jgi:hypothetical protein
LVAQESAMHFFMKDDFAAPASALPSLPTALVSQLSCAMAVPRVNVATNAANNTLLIMFRSLRDLSRANLIPEIEGDQVSAAQGAKR